MNQAKVRVSREFTLNGRVEDRGFRVSPYTKSNKDIIKIKKGVVRQLKMQTGMQPLVRIKKKSGKRYWLIKPVKKVRMMSRRVQTKAGIRQKKSGQIRAFSVVKGAKRRLSGSRHKPFVLYVSR